MRKLHFSMVAAGLMIGLGHAVSQTASSDLASPNQQLLMHFRTLPNEKTSGEGGTLVYSVEFRGKAVLDNSALALELDDAPALGSDVRITESNVGSGMDDYTLQFQKASKVHDAYNSLVLHVTEDGPRHRAMDIEARAYNGGVAFRYVLPQQASIPELHLKQEDTEFRLVTDATDWLLALPNYRSSYESEYVKLPTSALSNQGGVPSHFLIGMPLLMHEPGIAWLALMEADIEGNSTMYVTNPSGNWAGH